jgi:hypothetical protein
LGSCAKRDATPDREIENLSKTAPPNDEALNATAMIASALTGDLHRAESRILGVLYDRFSAQNVA